MKLFYRIFIMLCAFCVMLSLNRIAVNTTPPDRPVNLVVWSTNTVTVTNIHWVNVTNYIEPFMPGLSYPVWTNSTSK